MKKYDITAFGEILIDFTYVQDSAEGQKLFAQNAGGAPANVLVCATKFGATTAFLGKVGADMHGDFLKQTLQKEKVAVHGLLSDANYFTTLAFVDLNEAGERSFSFARKHGADTFMTPAEIDVATLVDSKVFHVGSLSLTTELGKQTTQFAVQTAKQAGAIISYDPNYRDSLWESQAHAQAEIQTLIPLADVMKISDEECALVTGESDPARAANVLLAQGVCIVCVTLGDKGVYVATAQGASTIAGFAPACVVDTTGAGDSFWGAFLHKLVACNLPLADIPFADLCAYARFANATASLCVEKSGAIRAMPTLEMVNGKLG